MCFLTFFNFYFSTISFNVCVSHNHRQHVISLAGARNPETANQTTNTRLLFSQNCSLIDIRYIYSNLWMEKTVAIFFFLYNENPFIEFSCQAIQWLKYIHKFQFSRTHHRFWNLAIFHLLSRSRYWLNQNSDSIH